MVGPREGGGCSKNRCRLGRGCLQIWVVLATANGQVREWAGDERRRKAEHGGIGTPYSRGASGTVIGYGADEVGSFFWRSRAPRFVGSVTRRLHRGDFTARRLTGPVQILDFLLCRDVVAPRRQAKPGLASGRG